LFRIGWEPLLVRVRVFVPPDAGV
jgi:hypothetical protein